MSVPVDPPGQDDPPGGDDAPSDTGGSGQRLVFDVAVFLSAVGVVTLSVLVLVDGPRLVAPLAIGTVLSGTLGLMIAITSARHLASRVSRGWSS